MEFKGVVKNMHPVQVSDLKLKIQGLDPIPIAHCFSKGGRLTAIVQHAKKIITWKQRFNKALPLDLKAHCRVINVSGRTLIAVADSSVWAMRLRYLVPSLLAELMAYAESPEDSILDIRCRVALSGAFQN